MKYLLRNDYRYGLEICVERLCESLCQSKSRVGSSSNPFQDVSFLDLGSQSKSRIEIKWLVLVCRSSTTTNIECPINSKILNMGLTLSRNIWLLEEILRWKHFSGQSPL